MQVRRSARRREALSAVGTRDELPVFDRGDVVAAVNWLSPLVGEWMDRLRLPQGRGHGRVAWCKSGCVDLRACTSGVYSTSQGA